MKLLLLTFVSCVIGKQGVFFNEMPTRPSLKLNDNILTIKTSNSIKNSALLIYKIKVSVNQNKKEIYMSADQAVGKKYKDLFTIKLSDYKIKEATTYSFYWIDPDKKMTQLELSK